MGLNFFGFGGVVLSGTYTGTYTLAGTPTLSGTFAGTPTFSGAITFSAAGAAVTLSSGTGRLLIGTNPASTGAISLANAAVLDFRNAGNNGDVDAMTVSATDVVRIGPGAISVMLSGGGGSVGFFGTTPVAVQASAANLTNSVTAGGTNDTIANYTDLVTYSNDAAAIRNDIYQLARKLKQVNDGLRAYGLLT